MKIAWMRYRSFFASATLCSAILVMASSVHGALLFSEDFESYSLNASLQGTPNWPNTSTGSGFTANVVNGGTPFGTSTQYLDFNDASASGGLRVLSGRILAPYNVVTTFSFDFYEPADGGSSTLNAGYAAGTDLGTGTTRNRFSLSNGTIGVGITGTSTSYNLDTPYRIYMVFNDTSDAITFESQTIAAGAAGIWYEDLNAGGGVKTFAGISTYSDAAASTLGYAVGFRSWSSALQQMYVDNVSWYAGASFTPPAPPQILYWDGTPGTPDGASSGGSGTWSTNDANWDTGSEYVAWDNTDGSNTTAVLAGPPHFGTYTITLGSDISLNAISMPASGNSQYSTFEITGLHTLNFGGFNSTISTDPSGFMILRLYCGVSGKPDIIHKTIGQPNILSPQGALTMDLGVLNISRGNANPLNLSLGGATTNSAEGIHYQDGNDLNVTKTDSGTWNLGPATGDGNYIISVNQGTLNCSGTWGEIKGLNVNGGRLAGTATILGAALNVTSGSVAPGNPTGVMTVTNASFSAGTSLDIYVDGNASPTYSSLASGGTLNISNATLNVNVVSPPSGAMTIASGDTLVGTFAATNNLPNGWRIEYLPDSVSLVPTPRGTLLIVR